MSEKYSPELVEKYLKELKKQFPDHNLHLLESAILQYLFLDCDKEYKTNENNEDYLKQKNYTKKRILKQLIFQKNKLSKL